MNSMIFLVSLISFVSLCQSQITPDGTAAVDALLLLLSEDADVKGFIKIGLDLAMASKTGAEQTSLKAASDGQINTATMILLGPDVIAAATAAVPEEVASNFLDRVLVTSRLDTALAITGASQALALTGLATNIGLRGVPKMGVLKSDVGLLTDAEILTEGATFIAVAVTDVVADILAAVDPFTKKIETKANGITINKIAVAVNGGILATLEGKLKTQFDLLEDAAEVTLEQSVKTLQPGEIKELGTAVTTAGDAATDIEIKALFKSINTAASDKTTTINKLVTALNVDLTGTQLTKLTTAITTAYDALTPAKKTELQKSTTALKAEQIQTAGAALITAVKADAEVPTEKVTTFFHTINSVANNSPLTQCSVTLLIASMAASAMCRSIGFF